MADEEIQVRVTADASGVQSGMSDASDAVTSGTGEIKDSFEGIGSALEGIQGQIKAAFEISGIAFAIEAVKKLGEEMDELALKSVQVGHVGEMLGVSRAELQGLHAAAEEAGVGADRLDSALEMLALRMQQARDGNQQMQDKLRAVGITLKDLADPSFTAAKAAYAISASHADVSVKMDVVGRRGLALLEALHHLSGGQQGAIDKAKELGATTAQEALQLAEYHKAVSDATEKWDYFKTTLAAAVAPALTALITSLGKMFDLVGSKSGFVDALGETSRVVAKEFLQWAEAARELVIDVRAVGEALGEAITIADKAGKALLLGNGAELNAALDSISATYRKHNADILAARKEMAAGLQAIDDSVIQNQVVSAQKDATGKLVVNEKELKDKREQFLDEWAAYYQHITTKNIESELEANTRAEQAENQAVKIREKQLDELVNYAQALDLRVTKEHTKSLEELTRANDNYTKVTEKGWIALGNTMENSISSNLSQILAGTESVTAGMRNLFRSMADAVIKMFVDIGVQWAETAILQKVLGHTTAQANITDNAAVAGAAGVASWAAAPWPIDLGAPAFGDAMAAAAQGFSLASAAGGYDIPSNINPVTQLHAQEMVLPANLANAVRSMAAAGNTYGGSTINNHFHDRQVTTDQIMAHFSKAMRNFHPALRTR